MVLFRGRKVRVGGCGVRFAIPIEWGRRIFFFLMIGRDAGSAPGTIAGATFFAGSAESGGKAYILNICGSLGPEVLLFQPFFVVAGAQCGGFLPAVGGGGSRIF